MASRTAYERVNRWDGRRGGTNGYGGSNRLEFDDMSPSSGQASPEEADYIPRAELNDVHVQEYDGPTFEERERQEYVFVEDVGDWRSEFRDTGSMQNSLEKETIENRSQYHIATQTKDQLEGLLRKSKKQFDSVHQPPLKESATEMQDIKIRSIQEAKGTESGVVGLQLSQNSLGMGLNSLKKQQTGVSQDSFVWSAKSLHSFEPLSLGMTNQSLDRQLSQVARPPLVQSLSKGQNNQQAIIVHQQEFNLREDTRSSGEENHQGSEEKR